MNQRNVGKYTVLALCTVYFSLYIFNPARWGLLDYVNLIFHEAGHILFLPFGEFMHFVGGTLGQLIFPIAAFFSLYKQQQHFSAALTLFWLGQNWINISVYARDARARNLPLLGGEGSEHDWSYLLYQMNLLHHDQAVGNFFFALGILSMLGALALAVYFLNKNQAQ